MPPLYDPFPIFEYRITWELTKQIKENVKYETSYFIDWNRSYVAWDIM